MQKLNNDFVEKKLMSLRNTIQISYKEWNYVYKGFKIWSP